MTDEPAPTTDPLDDRDRKKWTLFLIVAALSLIADQVTKIWARDSLPVVPLRAGGATCIVPDDIVTHTCQGHPVSVISGFWDWRLSMNPGSAFGLFGGPDQRADLPVGRRHRRGFGMFWMLRKARHDQKILHWALALVAGGAIGNLIDRIYFGVVTDFILWRYQTHEWPVFNVADVVLVIGVGLMFIDIQKEGRREKALKAGRQDKAKAAGLIKDLTGK